MNRKQTLISLAALGFAPEDAAKINPGIVYVTLSAYGHAGPWAGRRGFDSLVQTATGFNHAEGQAAGLDGPKELPAQMLDHATGYLMAFGAMMAKARQSREGGSWHVRVSLAQTGRWLWSLGRLKDGLKTPDIPEAAVHPAFIQTMPSGFGTLKAVNPQGTTQTCTCGAAMGKELSDREHVCTACGLIAPRDVVSAQVILERARMSPSNRNVAEGIACVV